LLVLQNNSPLSHAGKATVNPSMVTLIKEANRDFGGFWPREKPWEGRSDVRVNACFSASVNVFILQIPAAQKLQLPVIKMRSSEFGELTYAEYWALVMRMQVACVYCSTW